MNRNVFAVIGLLAIGFVTFTSSPATVPAVKATTAVESTAPILPVPTIGFDEQDTPDSPDAESTVISPVYALTADVCTNGSCSTAGGFSRSASVGRSGVWYPTKRLAANASARRSSGDGWRLGSNVKRFFAARRASGRGLFGFRRR